jgi:O-antigen/teichoic acid export membrane protein
MNESPDTIKRNVIRSTLWAGGTRVLSQGVTLFTTIVLARLLMKEDFGLMAMVLTYTGFIDTFIDCGFLSAIIQIKEISHKLLTSCFWFLLTGAILVGLATIIFAPFVAHLFKEPRLQALLPIMVLALLCVPSQIVCKGILSRNIQIDLIVKLELIAGLIRSGISIFFAYSGAAVWSLVYGYLFEKLALAITLPLYAKWYPRFHFDKQGIQKLLSFGMHTTTSGILWYFFNQADVFIIGRLLGAGTLGIYTMASQFAAGIYQFLSLTVNRVAYPLFSKYQQSQQLIMIFIKTSAFFGFFTFPLCIGLAAIAPDVITVLLGNSWKMATFPLQMLSLVTVIRTVSNLVPSLFNSIGHPYENVKVNVYSCIVFPVTFYWAAKWMGLSGILWSWVILYPLRYVVLLAIAYKLIRLPVITYVKWQLGTVVATVFMFFVVFLISHIGTSWNIYVRLALCITCGAISYLASQFFLSKRLIMELLSFIKKPAYQT